MCLSSVGPDGERMPPAQSIPPPSGWSLIQDTAVDPPGKDALAGTGLDPPSLKPEKKKLCKKTANCEIRAAGFFLHD